MKLVRSKKKKKKKSCWDNLCLANSISEKLEDVLKSDCCKRKRLSVAADSHYHMVCNVFSLFPSRKKLWMTSLPASSVFCSAKEVGVPPSGGP